MNHTHKNTPYEVEQREILGIKHTTIVDDCGEVICRFDLIDGEKETASFMVQACNAHNDLLEALKGMLEWARRVKEKNPGLEILNACNAIQKAEANLEDAPCIACGNYGAHDEGCNGAIVNKY